MSGALGIPFLGLLSILALILLNAYFVATEFALVSVRRRRSRCGCRRAAAAHERPPPRSPT
jgi:hypothetical protein